MPPLDDSQGWKGTTPTIVFAQIRQKDIKNSKGDVLKKAGTFKFNDDRDDQEELEGIIIATNEGRVYWEKPGDTIPLCKSLDGKHSINGKNCLTCEFSKWGTKGKPPKCGKIINILFTEGTPKNITDVRNNAFVVSIHGSSIKPWNTYFKSLLKQELYPVNVVTLFKTKFIKESKGEYYIIEPEMKKETVKKALIVVREVRENLMEETQMALPENIENEEIVKSEQEPEKEPEPKVEKTEKGMRDELLKLADEKDFDEKLKILNAINVDIKAAYKEYIK